MTIKQRLKCIIMVVIFNSILMVQYKLYKRKYFLID